MDAVIRPKVVLLTGQIGTGKSQVGKMFSSRGVVVIDADEVARTIQTTKGHDCLAELDLVFPGCIQEDGTLNRAFIRNKIANDPQSNKYLIEIMTPHVMAELQRRTVANADHMYVMWESALIPYGHEVVDRTLLVTTSYANQIARIKARNPDWDDGDISGIIAQQQHMIRCNDLITNDSDLADLEWEVNRMHQDYQRLWELQKWD